MAVNSRGHDRDVFDLSWEPDDQRQPDDTSGKVEDAAKASSVEPVEPIAKDPSTT